LPFLQTDRGRFFFNEFGSSGPILYLLHGLTAKNQDWGGVPDILAKMGFHIFTFDMKGHGQSDKPEDGYFPEDHARDIDACVRALGHTGIHVIGHSTGGRNALFFSVLFPKDVLSLVIIDQTLTADPEGWKKYQERFAKYPAPFANEEALEKYIKKISEGDVRKFDYFKGQFSPGADGRWDWNFSTTAIIKTQKLGREKDIFELLAQVKCPAFFIKGGDSAYVPPEDFERIKKALEGRVAVVEKAGHAVFRDNSEGFLKALIPFLKTPNKNSLATDTHR